jgi:1-acyl-sn-glycerol-3-phosphate acyltransferase
MNVDWSQHVPPHGWSPSSGCGPRCLAQHEPTVHLPRRWLRLLAAGVVLACLAVGMRICAEGGRSRILQHGSRLMLRALGVRLEVSGATTEAGAPGLADSGGLVVCNHVSWLDGVACNALLPARSVARADVLGVPLLGSILSRGGAFDMDRAQLSTLPSMIAEVAEALRIGAWVTIFPQGTTSCERHPGRYRPAMFQAALDAGVSVWPIAVGYRTGDRKPSTAAVFVGDDSLWKSVRRVARARGLIVHLHVLPPLKPVPGMDRRTLAGLVESRVNDARRNPSARADEPQNTYCNMEGIRGCGGSI